MFGNYKNTLDRVPEGILKLKGEKEIYLYGNGIYAKEMLNILDRFYIDIKGVLVSEEFISNENLFYGREISAAENFLQHIRGDIVIVAGFDVLYHKQLTDSLVANRHVKKIYVLNGCQVFWRNGFRFMDPKVYLVDNYYEALIRRNLTYSYFKVNYRFFFQTYQWLMDKKSRKTMDDYLRGHIELNAFPMLGVWENADVGKQYFPEDIVYLKEDEIIVDCGAYTGDTLESFLKLGIAFKRYYALEPDARRFDELHSRMSDNVIHIPVGAWNKRERLDFSTENECGEITSENKKGGTGIEADKLDNLIESQDRVTFIKMDIEGAELQALHGAKEIIKRDKPTLAICVYHKREDLITIPQYIKCIVPEYKLYLRAHFAYASEVVLYAVYE